MKTKATIKTDLIHQDPHKSLLRLSVDVCTERLENCQENRWRGRIYEDGDRATIQALAFPHSS